ncbi:hypothetical protein [Pseudorhodoferax soli]|uniref:Collagen triple helix repeat protein n=1 Tax=Pseudorhodoferax soli TaxID=545864 RepID=A0A368Y6I6_9BURK|nr:hypothetical protein [Pseudorhodoferax soli]RCW73814.1 hypothetical protein DES41_102128 [Pseudorhodoferax soli]
MFDPELFGQAMGEEIRKAVAPLLSEISELKTQLAQRPDFTALVAQEVAKAVAAVPVPADGKDCDMEVVQTMVTAAVKALPVPKDGNDGENGRDGRSVTIEDLQPLIASAVKSVRDESADAVAAAIKALPVPKDGEPGLKGDPGEKGADGIGLAGAMIDRDGALLVTLTNGTVKSLGPVVGKDGKDGTDGADGMSLDAFDLTYLEETHEVAIKAACAGRTKEVRFPAGGLRPGSYWREGTKAKACEAWVHDGSLWIATKDTSGKPQAQSEDWIIAARKGRDGESIVKTIQAGPPAPIKLGR